MISQLKSIVSIDHKIKARLFLSQFKKIEDFSLKIDNTTNKRVFIFLAADYGNLGDVAITYAQHKFLQNNFPNHVVQQIPISETIEGIALLKKVISKHDIITTVGGGNMGDLYPMIESFRQHVISNFKNNKVICFPQTVDFTDSTAGNKALQNAIRVYSNHPNLILLAREKKTFDFFKTHFKANTAFLVPDIVLTLDKTKPIHERSGVIICLRNDKEKKLNANQEESLLNIIDSNFSKKTNRDTHIGGEQLPLLKRTKALDSIWSDFRSAELVITDRLHGMIFCYITNTPALVFLNNNHKIKSSFHWVKTAKHIHLIEDFSEEKIKASIAFLKLKENKSPKENLLPFYKDVLKSINPNNK
ncbi:polysaccharide pyruvyl transferase family protein [Algibacter miyuki]|uniref:Polysaccharide pyruvyl transferase family protein n=1 Tax=Algibacter miyuki TaxID=1306933 RepID=A0ABV5GYB8_9FLAO|nr:polysaccharide pyruvyl transferase family protein [Algibacter miyuki]MDN3667157.1 polysaccharide pyruvyl transferase family protein [Algibacter miyuki]